MKELKLKIEVCGDCLYKGWIQHLDQDVCTNTKRREKDRYIDLKEIPPDWCELPEENIKKQLDSKTTDKQVLKICPNCDGQGYTIGYVDEPMGDGEFVREEISTDKCVQCDGRGQL